jgi:hypothetical protein
MPQMSIQRLIQGEWRMFDRLIIATKGGKGLRLRDVAFGRKIVGTQIIKDIETVYVERTLPNGNGVIEASGHEPHADEFWKVR